MPTTSTATTRFTGRQQANAAAGSASLALLLAACSSPSARPADAPAAPGANRPSVVVRSVGASVYTPEPGRAADAGLQRACQAWTLDRDDVARFFAASREYPEGTQDAFYALPSTISGQFTADGQTWDDRINAAATATWIHGARARTFGCSDRACAPLVLLMPDDNAGR